jgi:hypothetical protein
MACQCQGKTAPRDRRHTNSMQKRPSPGVLPKPSTFISIIIYFIAFTVRNPGVFLILVIGHCLRMCNLCGVSPCLGLCSQTSFCSESYLQMPKSVPPPPLARFLPSLRTLLRRPSFTSCCKLLVHPIGRASCRKLCDSTMSDRGDP